MASSKAVLDRTLTRSGSAPRSTSCWATATFKTHTTLYASCSNISNHTYNNQIVSSIHIVYLLTPPSHWGWTPSVVPSQWSSGKSWHQSPTLAASAPQPHGHAETPQSGQWCPWILCHLLLDSLHLLQNQQRCGERGTEPNRFPTKRINKDDREYIQFHFVLVYA